MPMIQAHDAIETKLRAFSRELDVNGTDRDLVARIAGNLLDLAEDLARQRVVTGDLHVLIGSIVELRRGESLESSVLVAELTPNDWWSLAAQAVGMSEMRSKLSTQFKREARAEVRAALHVALRDFLSEDEPYRRLLFPWQR
jgi:hypothetical protein